MTLFVTGSTGYLGSYVVDHLLRHTDESLALLVRAKDLTEARQKLWRGLELHMTSSEFWRYLHRVRFVYGDLAAPRLGIEDGAYADLMRTVTSVLHIGSALNRRSEKVCMNTNLKGTLSVAKLALEVDKHRGLRRFTYVSTVAVAGHRHHEMVSEDSAIDWQRSDYDPYGRTKKFCEHMLRELLPNDRLLFLRPSIVMGDSQQSETTQFDMVRAFCALADLPVLPFSSDLRLDVVNADFVGKAVALLHQKTLTRFDTYHLSSGRASETMGEIARALSKGRGARAPRFVPRLQKAFAGMVQGMESLPRHSTLGHVGSLLGVFLPYITYDTVFDNTRVTTELGIKPVPFTQNASALYQYAKHVGFQYPHNPLAAVGPIGPVAISTLTEERAV